MLERSERECLRMGRRFLIVGLLVLAVCSVIARILIELMHSSPIAEGFALPVRLTLAKTPPPALSP